MAIGAIEPVRGWVPGWYSWAQFGCGARRTPVAPQDATRAEGEPRPIHRKATGTEKIPMDILLLSNNGELS